MGQIPLTDGVIMSTDQTDPKLVQHAPGIELLVRIKQDTDLVKSVSEIAARARIATGSFVAIGALKRARLGFFDQQRNQYQEILVDSPHEIAACTGNISLKDGQPFAHAHVVLADENGNTKAGHLFEGIVFVAEVHLRQVAGANLRRLYDKTTGLSLWPVD
jgi:uncharacterized protein